MHSDIQAQDKNIEEVEDYRAAIQEMLGMEEEILALIGDDPHPALLNLKLADLMLNIASHYIVIDGVTRMVLKLKNEESLNEARKVLYKSIIYMEQVVSRYIDAPYSDYEDMIMEISVYTPAQRYHLMRKMGFAIELLENAYGNNTKWKWAFVDMEGRYAAAAKNILNLKDVLINSEFESEHYEPTVRHLMLVKKLLSQAADRYRQKYELSTKRIDDFQNAILFLSSLRRLCIVTGDRDEAATAKKKLDIWNAKLTSDTEKSKNTK